MKPLQRNRMVVRQWELLQLLESGRRSLNQLAGELGVTTRTVRRDLEALEEAHFPIVKEAVIDDLTSQAHNVWRVFDWKQKAA